MVLHCLLFNIDPLNLANLLTKDAKEPNKRRELIQKIEINNGRLAMLATVGFVVQEYITGMYHNITPLINYYQIHSCLPYKTGLPVVSETPQFFGR